MYGIGNGLISRNTPSNTDRYTEAMRMLRIYQKWRIRAAVSTLFQLYDKDSRLFSTSCKASGSVFELHICVKENHEKLL